ncbi:Phage integrase family protein [Cnuella takakiae]|uniref:Phage integrase family protein n=1 Tax=Cnuella takakiae TaxID=1302690 RepID=A0A1M5ELR6_9BACT|nr:site-specific integrase [Cnuella takakiae]OLY91220.1 hypothetical protein BUE76_04370 [Cnuella takakiae]SHF80060.1 Phage integrase family protein [Cnuella takakiae]
MKVSFYLTRPKAKGEAAIFARLCYSGYKIKYIIPEAINPKFWNKDTQRARETQKFREYPEFNTRIDRIESDIKTVYRKYLNDHNSTPVPEAIKPLLDAAIRHNKEQDAGKTSFFRVFKDLRDKSESGARLNIKTGKPISYHTYKTYKTVFNHLEDFQRSYHRPIDFPTIDIEFYQDYMEYLAKTKKLATNTIGKHFQIIKTVVGEAAERGIQINLAYKSRRFTVVKEKSDSIYLTEAEIRELESLDLQADSKLDRVRDLFIIGCYTGLRYSDFSVLKPENINNGVIDINQTKTGNRVAIPVHPTVKRIIAKYDGQLPAAISNQKTNDYLKDIGKKLECLQKSFSRSITKGGTKVLTNLQKWEALTTHTARRSFATNEYLAGTPVVTIMAITGHKSEKTFLGYIKLAPTEHAQLLNLHWEKRANLKAI